MGFWDKKKDKLPIAHGLTTPDTSVEDAVDIVQNSPSGYTSKYGKLSEDVLNEYLNREPFEFDLNGDALYQQYKDKYIQQGKMAMMDTMGQAAAMTGGYGNSYAQSVGQQAYAAQLQNLNDVVPELYQMALDNYNRKGEEMLNKYALYSAEEQKDYDRWWNERQWEQQYGEEEVEEEAPTYPDWYQEGGTYSPSNPEEYNKVDLENLAAYLGIDDLTGMKDIVKAACEKFGTRDGNEAVDMAFQMMYRELNPETPEEVVLPDNLVMERIKTMTDSGERSIYIDSLQKSGLINGTTANYLRVVYSIPTRGENATGNTFNGSTREDAVKYLKDAGITNTAGIMERTRWARAKSQGSEEAAMFDTYEEYLAAMVEYLMSGEKEG